jgi:pyruvate dehydrogenase E1 component alpha subunit
MNLISKAELIAFESRIRELWEAGELPYLIHLCGGNEDQLIEIFKAVHTGDWVFSTHRSHYHALLSGICPERLEQLIRRGKSMFVFERQQAGMPACGVRDPLFSSRVNFFTSSILAGTCAIAVGVAWQLKQAGSSNRVYCFLGDGAEEQGHFYEAVLFADGHALPVTFIIEDNDRSVDTPLKERRGADRGSRAFPTWPNCVTRYRYQPTYPHAGSGCGHHIQFKP